MRKNQQRIKTETILKGVKKLGIRGKKEEIEKVTMKEFWEAFSYLFEKPIGRKGDLAEHRLQEVLQKWGTMPIYKALRELENLIKRRFPELPTVKIDRTTSKELLPLFLTKAIFSNFDDIPNIQDIITEEGKKVKRELTAKEKKDLETKTGEYKKDGYVWKEFPQYVIGFGYEYFLEYMQKIEEECHEKDEKVQTRPFLFPDMKREIEGVLKKARIYRKGQALAYGILGEVFLQKKFNGVSLSKGNAVYYLGRGPNNKSAYHEVKESLNSLRWLHYRIVGRDNSRIKKAWGNFIYNILEKPKEYILDINPMYVGCIQHFAEDEGLRSKREKKELFSRGYFNFPMKALAISGGYSASTQEFRNYLLREKGNKYLETKKYKVISQKIRVYIVEACLNYKRKNENYREFVNNILPILMGDRFIAKMNPPLDKIKVLSPRIGYKTNLKVYVPKIEELDKNLELVLMQKWGID